MSPGLFEGLSQGEAISIIEKVNKSASVQWIPSTFGLLSTGTIRQLETTRHVVEKEIKKMRMHKNIVSLSPENPSRKDRPNTPKMISCNPPDSKPRAVECVKKANEGQTEDGGTKTRPEATLVDVEPDVMQYIMQTCSKTLEGREKTNGVQFAWRPMSSHLTVTLLNGAAGKNIRQATESFLGLYEAVPQRRNSFGIKRCHEYSKLQKESEKNCESSTFAVSLPNKVSVKVIQGHITNQHCTDVIVNPCNNHLQNTSGVGASIIDNGGLFIQVELNKTLESMDTYPPGKIIKTSAGSLP